jgi:hypothetical protein
VDAKTTISPTTKRQPSTTGPNLIEKDAQERKKEARRGGRTHNLEMPDPIDVLDREY